MTSDADTQAKLSRKLKSATRQLVDARNYLVLALASLNAQQTAYYGEFLPSLLARVDGDFYDRLALFLKTYSDLETDFSAVLQSGIGVMVDSTAKITRDQDISLFRLKNGDLFDSRKPVAFEPAGNDQTNGIEVDDVSRVLLSSKLKGLIETEEDLIKQLNKAEKQLGGLRQIEDVLRKEPAYGDPSLSLEQVIEHEAAADNARLALASVRAQIALLRAAGGGLFRHYRRRDDRYLTLLSIVGLPKQAHGLRHNHDTPRSGGERAVALYPYAAQGPDELSLEEDDILDVIYVEEGGEWIKVRKGGETGMVPSSYVDIGGQPSSPAPSRGSKQSSNFDGEPNHGEEDTRSNWNGRGLGKVVAK